MSLHPELRDLAAECRQRTPHLRSRDPHSFRLRRERTELRSVSSGGTPDVVAYRERTIYHVYPWGEERIQQVLDPSPENPSFVEVGTKVEEKGVVCIIEAMKIMNEIQAELKGTVTEILVENGQPVEYGQRLFKVKLNS